ncbi:MFS transporter [Azohydromonas australica]|uniref:MFS transporter n=1 Tax=Azohydromonas australica TaxID=364039 RepID=UPI0003FCFDA9|nr:MFS transporter [Azohydromonas australica]
MAKTETWPARVVLMLCHCAGMVDLVALPVWIGTLIQHYRFDPQQAGGLATLFLAGAVLSSIFLSSRFGRISARLAASLGFGASAAAFFAMSLTSDFASLAALHAAAGLAAGCGLSATHGTIGRSANPHRLFAIVGMALGVFAIAFLGATPQLVAAAGGSALFKVFAGVMLVAALGSVLGFPNPAATPLAPAEGLPSSGKLGRNVWLIVIGVSLMSLVQAMIFSFVERIGTDRGFGFEAVTGVLIALGLVNLLPAPLAALLQRRLPAHLVVLMGPVAQAVIALVITQSQGFAPYAAATAMFAAVMIFTHTFAFGLLSALDPSGRAPAATPAMLMIGSAIGPVLGGTLVKGFGYGSLGIVALLLAMGAVACFSQLRPRPAPTTSTLA